MLDPKHGTSKTQIQENWPLDLHLLFFNFQTTLELEVTVNVSVDFLDAPIETPPVELPTDEGADRSASSRQHSLQLTLETSKKVGSEDLMSLFHSGWLRVN